MKQPIEMNTLSQVLETLRQRGNDNELTLSEQGMMESAMHNKQYRPEDLIIIKSYRFEGMSDPGDNAVIYLTHDSEGRIGYILDAYGTYSNHSGPLFDDFLKKMPVADHDEQEIFK